MDYSKLAEEFLQNTYRLSRHSMYKKINESMHGEIFALQYIASQKGAVQPSEISNMTHVSSARIAATLNSLESKGLITRRIDSKDRRRILVELTPNGKEEANKYFHKILKKVSYILSELGEHDATEFVRIINKLSEINKKTQE